MKSDTPSYHGYRFPPEIISHAVWLYHRFCMSFRDMEDLLTQRGITVSYEAIRLWCFKFGPEYARSLKRRQGRLGETWYQDPPADTATRVPNAKVPFSRSSATILVSGWTRPKPLPRRTAFVASTFITESYEVALS